VQRFADLLVSLCREHQMVITFEEDWGIVIGTAADIETYGRSRRDVTAVMSNIQQLDATGIDGAHWEGNDV
jgi:hypothetical protein